jgi:hypothetical protein
VATVITRAETGDQQPAAGGDTRSTTREELAAVIQDRDAGP